MPNNHKKPVVITIPLYKSELTENEKCSLIQCIAVLKKHPIVLVCGKNLDISKYEEIFKSHKKEFSCERFDDSNFKNIDSYSKFCLSDFFYERFTNYKYLLIYQLEAFVFKDELEDWCAKDFDYIGAPWNLEVLEKMTHTKFECGGNGGLSLRKIETMLKLMKFNLKNKTIYTRKSYKDIFNLYKKRKPISNLLNTPKHIYIYIFQNFIFKEFVTNEDLVIAKFAKKFINDFKFAPKEEAAKFSIESFCEYFYELNRKTLPFGSHNYFSHLDFWEKVRSENIKKVQIT